MIIGREKVYTLKDLSSVLQSINANTKTKKKNGRSKKVIYYDLACAFDIETSSFYYNSEYDLQIEEFKEGYEKRACMYCWQLGIENIYIIGRTWDEFKKTIDMIVKRFELNNEKRLLVYVHNLSYEYQWIRKILNFSEVFEVENRKVIKAVTDNGIEFRCSYALSNQSLEKVGKDLTKYKVDKLVGALDYKKIRNSKTPLTNEELMYCLNDIKVVISYIKESIERVGSIEKIPLTRTAYIRKKCSDSCFGTDRKRYHNFISGLTMDDEVYDMMKKVYQGGYVHCNAYYSNKKLKHVGSYDFKSSYPAIMVSYNGFPMSKATKRDIKTKEQFDKYIAKYACAFDVVFYNIRLKDNIYAPPISFSKCSNVKNEIVDNGRIVSAEILGTSVTEQDWLIYEKFYDWDNFRIGKFYSFERGRLPVEIVRVLLELYEIKCKYKGVDEMKEEYITAKGDLNCSYGMAVTDILKMYDNIDEYNKSWSRFLYYPWGVWISARARRCLFSGIYDCGEDFVYSDTDSVKMVNYESHKEYIERYNNYIKKEMDKAMDYYGIDREKTRIMGQQLGIWDFEGVYDEFKGIRAKAYFGFKNGEYELTLSGVNKKKGTEYLKSFKDPIRKFNSNLKIPKEYTGKLTHTYIDEEKKGTVIDYLGNKAEYNELSSIHMESVEYDMSVENEFINFLNFVVNGIAKV